MRHHLTADEISNFEVDFVRRSKKYTFYPESSGIKNAKISATFSESGIKHKFRGQKVTTVTTQLCFIVNKGTKYVPRTSYFVPRTLTRMLQN